MATETTTSNALLGLLSLRTWTAYELTGQMRRALRWVWPRSEANLYAALKKLSANGLATGIEERGAGARTRTRYEITPAGRDAAAGWLRDEPSRPAIEAEIVLRTFLADLGDRDDLRAALAATRRQVAEQAATAVPIFEQYASDEPPFPDRAHLVTMFIHFMAGHLEHLVQWCDDVEAELDRWPSTAGVGMTASIRERFDEAVGRHLAIVDRHLPEQVETTTQEPT